MRRTLALVAALLLAGPACRAGPAPAPPSRASAPAPAAAGPRRWADEVLYFVLVDRFADGDPSNDAGADPAQKGAFHGGDLRGLVDHLDEIASLGVTALWVNPLVQNIRGPVHGAGFPDWGYHGYWADDLSKLDPRFGTEGQLRELVEACHARGIKVLLDVVYNHPGYDSRYTRDPRTRGWLRSPAHGGCGDDDLTTCLAGLPDWMTERPEVRDWLISSQLEWARRFHLDGFRLDTVKHVDHEFWREHRRRTRAELGPGFFLLGEVWGGSAEGLAEYFAADELDAGFDFTFQGNALGWVMGRGRTVAFDHYLATRLRVPPGHLLAHFLSSHDVPGALYQLRGDVRRFRLAAALQLAVSGIPVVYYGEEVARPGGDWPANRSDMPWGDKGIRPGAGLPRDEALRDWYRALIAARRAHPALSRGGHQALATAGDLYVFARRDPESGDAVLVALNRSPAPGSVRVPAPAEWRGAIPSDLLGVARVTVAGGELDIALPGLGAGVLAAPPFP